MGIVVGPLMRFVLLELFLSSVARLG
uniref:Uncharacterized protein n=1 Tax=Lepeophtheirus salmonis TaxID=72036 RepID=A0A0K2T3W3_LEPSM